MERTVERGYPKSLRELGEFIGCLDLVALTEQFVHGQTHRQSDLAGDEETLEVPARLPPDQRVNVYHSASATFFSPSDPSCTGGMRKEYIRSCPNWRGEGERRD